jgi:long-subunit acyl-CoA synthetase (AMP-forming)
VASGEQTSSLKIKRKVVTEKYEAQLEALYED